MRWLALFTFPILFFLLSYYGVDALLTTHSTPTATSSPIYRAAYTQEEINYFLEVALGAEFTRDARLVVRKWKGDIRIQLLGSMTKRDRETVNQVVAEVNTLTHGAIQLKLSNDRPNVLIHFSPRSQFKQIEPNWKPENYGYVWVKWNEQNIISSANILIASEGVTQKERSHLIREELTQSLGLMQDSFKYSDSVFYQPWTDVNEYAAIDKALIRMLYDSPTKAGMTKKQILGRL